MDVYLGRRSDSLIFSLWDSIIALEGHKFALYYLSVTDWEIGIKNRDR